MKNKNLQENLKQSRVIFLNNDIRDTFFLLLKKKFNSWKNLRTKFKLYKSRLDYFRSGKISIPYSTFLEFLNHVDNKKYFLSNIQIKDQNWGRIKGGKKTYELYQNIFDEGRKKGSSIVKYKFDINTRLTNDLSEVLGAFIGDGFTNSYGTTYMTQFTGDNRSEREYYINKIIPTIKKISSYCNPILSNKGNTLKLTIYSKEFHNLLVNRFKLKPGKKVYDVTIPDEILKSGKKEIISSCIRGIFDTDGSVYFDKRNKYRIPYIRICLKMESKNLIKQIYLHLLDLGIKPKLVDNNRIIQINGVQKSKEYIKFIGFSNPRNLKKIKALN